MLNGESDLACRWMTTLRGFLLPLPNHITSYGGNHLIQIGLKSTLTVLSKIPQPRRFYYSGLERKVLKIGASNYGGTAIIAAEGRALQDGVQAAIVSGYRRFHIEGDDMAVIEALKGSSATPWQLKHII